MLLDMMAARYDGRVSGRSQPLLTMLVDLLILRHPHFAASKLRCALAGAGATLVVHHGVVVGGHSPGASHLLKGERVEEGTAR
jgi:hypothetical protein